MTRVLTLSCVLCLLLVAPAAAQDGPMRALRWEQISPDHLRFVGHVEIALDQATFFADEVDWYIDTNRIVASGNVVFATADGRIAADRVEYDIGAETGTFHAAAGILALGASVDRALFGTQEPDLYFHAERIEKIGPRRYRLTRGAFSTCVQPNPRWDVTTGTVTLRLDDYATARHTTLRVKGVPVLYVPFLYYPLHEDDRATGFLMPSYGSSTLRGQSLSNAFFWAIGRSHDATFFHDWFTRAGHGLGAEYRYAASPGSSGTAQVYRLGQRATGTIPATTSYQVSGTATHAIAPGISARARVDYFTDVVSQQLYQQDVYQASRTTRIVEAGLNAYRGPLSSQILYQRHENFPSTGTSVTYGSTPRITAALAPRRLFDTPLYASVATDYAFLPFRHRDAGVITRDDSLHRMDVTPTVRVGLSRLTFLSVNTSASYRATYYSRSADPATGVTMPEPFVRRYATAGVDVIGPVIERLWEAPRAGAPRLRHVVEPVFNVDVTSDLEGRTPLLGDPADIIVGRSARLTYGINNRFFRSGGTVDGVAVQAREFVTVGLQQTYYTNPAASVFDTRYMSAIGAGRPLDLSPVALSVRVSPTGFVDGTARLEYDVAAGRGIQALTAGSTVNWQTTSAHLNYSRRQIAWFLPADDFVSLSTTTRLLQGRLGGAYAVHWDVGRGYVVSQNVGTSYLAQCCGLQVEYQTFNFPPALGVAIAADRRINLSVILAGLGTFSNFLGAFGVLR